MGEDPSSRDHIKRLFLCAPLYLASMECSAKFRIGDKASILLLVTEGAHKLGFLDDENYGLLKGRYETPLEERVKWKESSHVPVVEIQKSKVAAKKRIDYSAMSLEELQKRYERADLNERQLIRWEAKKRNVELVRKEGAI